MRFLVVVVGLTIALTSATGDAGQTTQLQCVDVVAPSDSGSGRIAVVAPGPGGRLAWTDGRPGQFLLRDAAGRIRVVGRSGSGPGEFQRLGGMEWIGDSLWVGDYILGRVQLFSDTGALVRVQTAIMPGQWGARPSGRLVGFGRQLAAMTLPFTVLSHAPGATSIDTLAVFPLVPADRFERYVGGRMVSNPQPFTAEVQVGASQDYARFCAARPSAAAAVELTCVDDRGQPLLTRRVQLRPRPLTAAIYDSIIPTYMRGRGASESDLRSRIERPRNLPLVNALMVQNDGGVWLRRSHWAESPAVWLRLHADGSVRDEVELPKRYRILRVEADVFWATTADDDGLETLHRCRQ